MADGNQPCRRPIGDSGPVAASIEGLSRYRLIVIWGSVAPTIDLYG